MAVRSYEIARGSGKNPMFNSAENSVHRDKDGVLLWKEEWARRSGLGQEP